MGVPREANAEGRCDGTEVGPVFKQEFSKRRSDRVDEESQLEIAVVLVLRLHMAFGPITSTYVTWKVLCCRHIMEASQCWALSSPVSKEPEGWAGTSAAVGVDCLLTHVSTIPIFFCKGLDIVEAEVAEGGKRDGCEDVG